MDSVAAVKSSLRCAAATAGCRGVRLVAVSKTRSAPEIAAVAAAGVVDFGENYLQEALPKIRTLAGRGIVWHFVGAIQSNKARDVARHFDWVHSVDRLEIANRLHRGRAGATPLNVCVQVNIDADANKVGVAPEALAPLIHGIRGLDGLCLRGLMAVPVRRDSPAATRPSFLRMAALFEAHRAAGGACWDTLSMGMSEDYLEAVAAGATCVRLGTAIFGPRPPREAAAGRQR